MDIRKMLLNVWPHLAIIVGFVLISFMYFYPVLEGKQIPQMDHIHAQGMAQELTDFEKNNPGKESQWTNSMFGGMPAYQIKGSTPSNVYVYVMRALRFGLPYSTVAIVFTYLVCFYILLLAFNVNRTLAVLGALAFAFASYNIIIIEAGHITKTYAIAFMAPVIAGVVLTYRGKLLAGSIITMLALGLEIATNHVQITYYLALTIMVIVLVQLVYAFKNKTLPAFAKASGMLLLAAVLAVVPATRDLWTTYEYGQESIRGASELSSNAETQKSSGLDKEYALAWSYGKLETFTLFIPNFKGGGVETLDADSKTFKTLQQQGLSAENAAMVAQNTPTYWGDMPFTSGPVYFGAIVFLLLVLGFLVLRGPDLWWMVIAAVLSILLSWGRNFEWFTDLFFYYFPLYNKFRTVSMILVVTNLVMTLMAVLALNEFLKIQDKKAALKKLYISAAVAGGIILLVAILGSYLFEFKGRNDDMILSQLRMAGMNDQMLNAYSDSLRADRAAIMRADAFRSLGFIAVAFALLYASVSTKVRKEYLMIGLAVVVLADMWVISRRYLNEDDFVSKSVMRNQFALTQADELIKKDADQNYRVLNLTRSVFNDAYTPYFHKSIGGYHGAKLRRYQELIDSSLITEITALQRALSSQNTTERGLDSILNNSAALNMLNTKYVVYAPTGYLVNMSSLGSVWLVDEYQLVENADEEIKAIRNFDPRKVAIVDKRFASQLEGYKNVPDSANQLIALAVYNPNYLLYQVNTTKQSIAVFSEIYYDKGWKAYLDEKPVSYFRTNYVLRGMVVPAGKHKIEFKFEPDSFAAGGVISWTASAIVILILVGYLLFEARNFMRKNNKPVQQNTK